MVKRLIAIFLFALSLQLFAGEYAPQQGYSFEPLKDPVFEYAHVVVDVTAFNNWLNANYSKLNAETMKGPREHLYYLLCSYISAIHQRDKVILPKNHDLILEILFSWSERLGVFGGSLVYNKIKREDIKPIPELMKIPDSFSLSLTNDLYSLKTKTNVWSVKFPYYFMVGNMNDFQATNGMKTQLVSISTGASKDNTEAGRSQGTLMLIYSPSNEFESFSSYWLSQFEIHLDSKAISLGVKNLTSRAVFDKTSLLHKEVTLMSSKNGSFAIAFLGMDGTYQANRQHYLDFLNQLQVASEAAANQALQPPPKSVEAEF